MADSRIKSPFKFLDPFTVQDIDAFFGRDKEVKTLYEYVNKNRVVLLYGQSGTGKTSIIQCGLANAFEPTDWLPVFVKRGEDINTSLRDALAFELKRLTEYVSEEEIRSFKEQLFEEVPEAQQQFTGNELETANVLVVTEDRETLKLEDKKAFAKNLRDEQETVIATILLHIKRCTEIYLRPVYLILDQFEELLILGTKEEKKLFTQTLKYLVDQNTTVSCHVIIVMREEYFACLDPIEQEIPEIADRRLRVEMVRGPQAKKIIKDSCRRFNITLENPDQNADQVVKAFSKMGDISLPYLQVYLDQLWKTDFVRTYPNGYEGSAGYAPVEFTMEEIQEFGAIEDVLLRYVKQCIEAIQESLKVKFPALMDENSNFLYDVFDVIVTTEKTKHPLPFEITNGKYVFKSKSKKFEQLDKNALLFTLKSLESYRIVRDDGKTFELAHDSMGPIISDIRAGKRPKLAVPEITGNPYKGLLAYEEDDCKMLFGRERVIAELLKKFEHNNLVIVVGPPGAGKSSLIKAGLLPRVKKMDYHVIVAKPEEVVLVSGKNDQYILEKPIQKLEREIYQSNHARVILYIDKFEQLIDSCQNENKKIKFLEFINSILSGEKADGNTDVKVVMSIRSDYEFELDKYFGAKPDSKLNVPPFLDSELRDIITEPAYLSGLEFSPDYLVDTILRDTKKAKGSVPLLSHALRAMYNEYDKKAANDGLLTEDMYNEVGGVAGSIPATADRLYNSYPENSPHRNTLRNIMLRMVTFGVKIAGKRVLADELHFPGEEENKRAGKILNDFVADHLLVKGKDDTGKIFYEPVHDILVQKWAQIDKWVTDDKAKAFFYYTPILKEAIKGKKLGKLWYNDPRLDDLQKIATEKDSWLNRAETEFVWESVKKREEINKRKKNKEQELIRIEQEKSKLIREKALQQEQANSLLAEKLEEQRKAEQLLKEKLAEEQKVALLYQEKLEEEKKAALLSEEKLLEQQKRTILLKRSRRGLLAGIVALLAFGVFYFLQIAAKEQGLLLASQSLRLTNDSLLVARDAAQRKTDETLRLLDSNKVLLTNNQLLLDSNIRLVSQYREKSETVTNLLEENRAALVQSQKDQDVIRGFANTLMVENRYKDSINLENEIFRERLALQKEPFYTDSYLDSLTTEQYLDSLLATKFNVDRSNLYRKPYDSVKYANYKTGLNKISDALREVRQNPNKALVLSKQAFDLYPNDLTDSIGLSIANNNLFYKSKVELQSILNARIYLSALSPDQTRFAMATEKGIHTGNIIGDSIVLDKLLFFNDPSDHRKTNPLLNFQQKPRFSSLVYRDAFTLLGSTDDGSVYQWQNGNQTPSIQPPNTGQKHDYYLSALSSSGKSQTRAYDEKLLGAYRGINIEAVDLENGKKTLWRTAFGKDDGELTGIKSSKDGKTVLATIDDSKYWILDLKEKSKRQLPRKDIYSATFSPEGKHIVFETRDSIFLMDLQADFVGNGIRKNRIAGFLNSSALQLSADWRSLVVQNSTQGNRLYEGSFKQVQNDSLFFSGSIAGREVKSKNLGTGGVLGLMNNRSVLSHTAARPLNATVGYIVGVGLMKNYGYFNNFEEAYNTINPYLTKEEKTAIGLEQPSDQDLYGQALKLRDQSEDNLLSKATRRNYLLSAKEILRNLLKRSADNYQYFYRLKEIDRALYLGLDSNYVTYAVEVKKHIAAEENLLRKYAGDTASANYQYYKGVLAGDYGSLSYYLAFTEPADSSAILQTARKALELDPARDFVYTNIALAYLLSKDFAKAKEVYTRFKGAPSNSLYRNFTAAFLEDLDELESKGRISNTKEPEIYNYVQNLKCWLQNKGCTLE